jgi:probable rRNA maturation factor
MLETCPEVIVSVGSAAEADTLLTTLLATHPMRESAPRWLREEAIPQAICCLMEQVRAWEGGTILELSVWLTTNDEIASLNARYRGLYAPTDVLSFPAGTIPAPIPELPLGDVVVSVEQAAQQAKLNGHDFVTELLMLCLHGTLHLLGYDDQTDAQRAHMNQIAVRTLRALGYPAKEEWSSRHYEG